MKEGNKGIPSCRCSVFAIRNSLAEVKEQLFEGEYLFAHLDDIYVLAKPDRSRRFTTCWARDCSRWLGSNSSGVAQASSSWNTSWQR